MFPLTLSLLTHLLNLRLLDRSIKPKHSLPSLYFPCNDSGQPIMGASVAIEAAQSRPPSSLGPSDFADLGSAKTTFACCACAAPASPCCMT